MSFEPVNLFFACDTRYLPLFGVALTSLKNNRNPQRRYRVYVLHTDVPEENQTPEVKEENNSDKADSKDKTKEKNTGSDIIKKYTAKFYSLKAYYLGQLGSIESQAKSDYSALTKEQKKSLSKTAFASKYINYALSLESECDSQVESLLAEMKREQTLR